MTDDARIARLTKLARKVWQVPSSTPVVVEQPFSTSAEVWIGNDCVLRVSDHPRALDALEAALCVLADELPEWVLGIDCNHRVAASQIREKYGVLSDAAYAVDKLRCELLLAAKVRRP